MHLDRVFSGLEAQANHEPGLFNQDQLLSMCEKVSSGGKKLTGVLVNALAMGDYADYFDGQYEARAQQQQQQQQQQLARQSATPCPLLCVRQPLLTPALLWRQSFTRGATAEAVQLTQFDPHICVYFGAHVTDPASVLPEGFFRSYYSQMYRGAPAAATHGDHARAWRGERSCRHTSPRRAGLAGDALDGDIAHQMGLPRPTDRLLLGAEAAGASGLKPPARASGRRRAATSLDAALLRAGAPDELRRADERRRADGHPEEGAG